MLKLCKVCGVEFDAVFERVQCCSIKCRGISQRKPDNCWCEVCGKGIRKKPYILAQLKNPPTCSYECCYILRSELMRGENNHQHGLKGSLNSSWKQDRKLSNYGYWLVRDLNHPFGQYDGYVREHRLVVERDGKQLNEENSIEIDGKRFLKREYHVHHIDENKQNNNIENLKVLHINEHMILHKSKNKKLVS